MCVNRKVTGIDYDGGYAEYMIAPAEALAAIPDELPAEEAGPFMCAGVTVFNALRNSGARPGDVVAVQGSAASDILACNTLAEWDSKQWRWDVAKIKNRSRKNSARTITSIRMLSIRSLNCRSSVARE